MRAREVESLSFHSLRRTATTLLHQAGIPAAVAQGVIGHDSSKQFISSTSRSVGKL